MIQKNKEMVYDRKTRQRVDDLAVDILLVRLIISIAIIAAVFFIVAFGYTYLKTVLSEKQVENDCNIIQSKIYTMLRSGVPRDVDEINAVEGTKRTCTFDLPDNIVYLAFGVDPDPDNDGYLETGLTMDGAVIFYRVDGGSKKVIWLNEDFKFREGKYDGTKWVVNGDGQGYIITGSGRQTLNFELVEKNHRIYVLIQANDGIES
ncbi:MAG: hypothetical protein DRM99_04395 [Thermoplasmata archaeon]|nr:MAG: hypothetical protein DRM99_04395 [Thermoplasmata archaeon]RLF50692.1 MAG: hypothetical protein DRN24_06110 [Thermoplasmata archaeon]